MKNHGKNKRLEKLSDKEILDITFDLINAFKSVKTPMETALLMQELLTAKEIRNISKRLRIAKLLLSGKTQAEITKEVHCSFATVTKVGLWLNQGGEGLKLAISKLPKRYKTPKIKSRGPIEFHLPQTLYDLYKYSLSKNQQMKIQSLDSFMKSVKGKRVLDKALREMFDQDYKKIASRKKSAEFKKKILEQSK